MASTDRVPRFMAKTSASKARQSLPLTAEPAKAIHKNLFATVKARLSLSTLRSRNQIDPLNAAVPYEDIAPASEHPRVRIPTSVSRLPAPSRPSHKATMTRTVSGSPIPSMNSSLANKALPSTPAATTKSGLPKARRLVIGAGQRPPSQVIPPVPRVSATGDRSVLSSAKAEDQATLAAPVKTEQSSDKKLGKYKALPPLPPTASQNALRKAASVSKLGAGGTEQTTADWAKVNEHVAQLDSPLGQKHNSSTSTRLLRAGASDSPGSLANTHNVPRLLSNSGTRARVSPVSTNRVPPLDASFESLRVSPVRVRETKASTARLAANRERYGMEGKSSPAGLNQRGATQLPDPFRQRSPARGSGALAFSLPTRIGTLGSISASPQVSKPGSGTRSQYANSPLGLQNLEAKKSEDSMNTIRRPTKAEKGKAPERLVENLGGFSHAPRLAQDVGDAPSPVLRKGEVSAQRSFEHGQQASAGEKSQVGSDGSDSDSDNDSLATLRTMGQSKQGYQSRRLSSKYGPILSVSNDADRVLLGASSDADIGEVHNLGKRRVSIPANLARGGVVLKDSFRKSMHSLPRSFTIKSLSKMRSDDGQRSVNNGEGEVVPEESSCGSAGSSNNTAAAPMTSGSSVSNDLNKIASEHKLGGGPSKSALLQKGPLPSGLFDAGTADHEDCILPQHRPTNFNAKTTNRVNTTRKPTSTKKSIQNKITSSSSAFPIPHNPPVQPSKTPKTPKTTKESISITRNIIHKLRHKISKMTTAPNIDNDVHPNHPARPARDVAKLAHRILEFARAATVSEDKKQQLLTLADALIDIFNSLTDAELARERVMQASVRAEQAVLQCTHAANRALDAVEEVLQDFVQDFE